MTTVRLFELRQQHLVLLLVLAAVAVAAVFICWRGLTVRAWRVESPKLRAPLRLAVVADLHSSRFGRHQSRLLEAIDRLAPQLVLFAGDTVDDARPEGPAFELLEALGPRYPCLLVCGNHEYRTGQLPELKRRFAALGVTVLAGQRVDLPDSGPVVSGLDDPEGLDEDYARQLDQVGQTLDRSRFNILLAHRPEYFESYIPYGYDLVLCGHTHGGQWRLPGVVEGVYATGQGLFPTYAGGRYEKDGCRMIISRGLSKKHPWLPRIFNPPELTVVQLAPPRAPQG